MFLSGEGEGKGPFLWPSPLSREERFVTLPSDEVNGADLGVQVTGVGGEEAVQLFIQHCMSPALDMQIGAVGVCGKE